MSNLKYVLTFIIVILCFVASRPVFAQGSYSTMSSVNVDDLSDGQIQQLLQQEQAAGLTDTELLAGLQAKGMSADQVSKLRVRLANARTTGSKTTTNINIDTAQQASRRLNYKPDTTNRPKSIDFISALTPKIFGADLFRNGNLTFEPNLKMATPVNYVLGPDDQLIVNIYGNSVVNWNLNVSSEGNVNIPGVGILNVSGKTIEQATQAIKQRLIANNYPIGHGAQVQISLGNIRSIKVILVGEVQKPGTYTLPSLATVFNALYSAGGPNDNGSFRQIEIIRNNTIIRKLDVYDFLLKGEQKDNITLKDQDIIRIPPYGTRVEMDGEVKTPGIFEVLPRETLKDVIRFAGGFNNVAYTSLIKVNQVSDQQRRITDVAEKDFGSYTPKRGDKYTVERVLDRYENRVVITGAVFRPGAYELTQGMTLSQLIQEAAGLKEDAYTKRGSIIRLNPDNTTQSISFNVQDVLSKSATDIPLQREDSIKIASIFDLRDQYFVSIKGQVRRPGEFLYADSMTVEDLIIKAGGFTVAASTKRIEVARRVFNSDPRSKGSILSQVFTVDIDADMKEKDVNFTLKPFDIVSIYTLPGYEKQNNVKVEGEVLYPGNYTIQRKDERISDIIARAGGLTASADVEGGSLKRDNSLGIDKQRIDSAEILQLQNDHMNRVKKYKDSLEQNNDQLRNNYVGIDLKQILEKPHEQDDLILEDGDVIRIPKQQQVVSIDGEVLYPSAVVYTSGDNLKDYVIKAGGLSLTGDINHAYVIYPNGTVKGSKKFLFFPSHPRIKPGSEIIIPKKALKRPLSTQEVLGITSSIASLALIIVYIINNTK